MKDNFFDKTFEDLSGILSDFDPKPFRLDQVLKWVYVKGTDDFSQMTNMPKKLNDQLSDVLDLTPLRLLEEIESRDGTLKSLFQMPDGELMESVIIPEEGHKTLCLSTQAGCGMGCSFCETATIGLKRNLSQGEILAQIACAVRRLGNRLALRNLVFMGMGEPLLNMDALIGALEVIIDARGFDFSPRRVTVSTCGWVPGIDRLGRENLGVNLAVSLNAGDDETRNRLMPVNKKYPLKRLMKSIREYPLHPRQRITFEYVLIEGVNDRIEDARRMVNLLRGIPAKVNVIAYNLTSAAWRPPDEGVMNRFQKILMSAGLLATVRKSRGGEIGAACGQLGARAAGGRDA
jgi:23S rRNA (adenine2503-C2)-methyltransferase